MKKELNISDLDQVSGGHKKAITVRDVRCPYCGTLNTVCKTKKSTECIHCKKTFNF